MPERTCRHSAYVECPEKAKFYKGKPGLRVGTRISRKRERGSLKVMEMFLKLDRWVPSAESSLKVPEWSASNR